MNWYIGQSVVAIENHSTGIFKKGDVFEILALKKCDCPICGGIVLDIGKNHPMIGRFGNRLYVGDIIQCYHSHGVPYRFDGIAWFAEKRFAPLDTLCDISELTEILETTKPFEV